jgi:aminoglycoside phosphotransferase (APT) family kinase protein
MSADLRVVVAWMDGQGLGEGPVARADRIGGGTQNVLIRFSRSGRDYVLRRPPEHKRPNSDEVIRREIRVLRALESTDVPHPRLIAACPDTDVLGAAFYLMEPVEGFNPAGLLPGPYRSSGNMRRRLGLAMADGAACIGAVDYRAVGLGSLGSPAGYLERQVDRWRSQLESYSTFPGYTAQLLQPRRGSVAGWRSTGRPLGSLV